MPEQWPGVEIAPSSPSSGGRPFDEGRFQSWYHQQARTLGLNPNPDDPEHFYDYRAAFSAGAKPDETGHWPSAFKLDGHPRLVIDGVNTRTGEPVSATAWPGEEVVHADGATRPPPGMDPNAGGRSTDPLGRASSIGPTPWYAQGMFAGYGPSVLDAVDTLPSVGGAVGGVLGAASGAFAGLGLGAGPGAVGGAAVGGEAGEAARQNVRRAIGAYAPRTSGEAATQIGHEGGIQALAEAGGRLLPVAAGKGVKTLLPAPEKQYAQALGATTVPLKELSDEIVPELINRRVHGSRESIKALSEKRIAEESAKIDAELLKMPKGTAADTGAVMNQLQALKKQYVVPSSTPGANVIVDKAAYNNLSELQKLVASTQPTFESVRRLRQILDGQVTAGNKTFGRTIAEGSQLDATREAANAIRSELAKINPNIAKINKEFSFWMDVDRVVGATIDRTKSQSKGLGQTIAEAVAVPLVAGTAASDQKGIAATIAIPLLLRKLIQSPNWKTFSAVQKDRLADAIASGNAQRVSALLAHAGVGLVEASRSEQDGPEGTTR